MKEMVNYSEREEYLEQYLKDEEKSFERSKKLKPKQKKLYELPPMRFT